MRNGKASGFPGFRLPNSPFLVPHSSLHGEEIIGKKNARCFFSISPFFVPLWLMRNITYKERCMNRLIAALLPHHRRRPNPAPSKRNHGCPRPSTDFFNKIGAKQTFSRRFLNGRFSIAASVKLALVCPCSRPFPIMPHGALASLRGRRRAAS